MKKILAALLLFLSLFPLTACRNPQADWQNDPIVPGEWGIYVGFKSSENENVTPHKELLYKRTYADSGEGNGSLLVSNGALMFLQTSSYLPTVAASIPTVRWSETFQLLYQMDDSITYKGGETFYVYGEDFTELAKAISSDELIAKSRTDWRGKTVYIQFGGIFYNELSDDITEDIENAYFVKTTF